MASETCVRCDLLFTIDSSRDRAFEETCPQCAKGISDNFLAIINTPRA